MRPVLNTKVEEAVKQMEDVKAHGTIGFTVKFSKDLWDLVKNEVSRIVEDSRSS